MTGVFAIAGRSSKLGEADLVDLCAAVAAGDTADAIASRFGVTTRTVDRWRAELRRQAITVRIPEGGGSPVKKCERCAERPAAEEIEGWSVCQTCAPKERAKNVAAPVVDAAAEAARLGALAASDLFRCEYFKCDLMARACVERQAKEPRVSVDHNSKNTGALPDPFKHCNGGTCHQGAVIKLRVGDAVVAAAAAKKPIRSAPADVAAIERRIAARAAPERCSVPDCELPLTAKAVDGVCGRHAEAARRRTAAAPPPPGRPAAPAQEKQMRTSKLDELSDDQVRELHKKYGGGIKPLGEEVGCSAGAVRTRLKKLGLYEPVHTASTKRPAPKKSKPAAAKPAAAPPVRLPPPPPKPTIGEHHHVELPDVEQLPLEYLLACVAYARAAQDRLGAALSGAVVEITSVRSAG